jgi:hypothetical protein
MEQNSNMKELLKKKQKKIWIFGKKKNGTKFKYGFRIEKSRHEPSCNFKEQKYEVMTSKVQIFVENPTKI